MLVRYALERLLYRLATSPHREAFVLKGAMLFLVWGGDTHRPTRDLDLLGFGEPSPGRLAEVFRALATMPVTDDGVEFHSETVQGEEIRTTDGYGGVRVSMRASIASADIPIQVDIGFGDAMTPSAAWTDYPTILDMPAPTVLAYSKETVVAEKTEALVKLGMLNSRFKDYFDLATLGERYAFDGPLLARAMHATFDRRGTAIPAEVPSGLTTTFAEDHIKQQQWRAFCRRGRLADPVPTLAEVVTKVVVFVLSPLHAAAQPDQHQFLWKPGGPWQQTPKNVQE